MKRYEADLAAHYDKALATRRRAKKTDEPPPTKPDPPCAARYIVSDTTVEAVSPLLLMNPRGVRSARDELAGWIGSFDRYAGGKGGADAAHWLSMFLRCTGYLGRTDDTEERQMCWLTPSGGSRPSRPLVGIASNPRPSHQSVRSREPRRFGA